MDQRPSDEYIKRRILESPAFAEMYDHEQAHYLADWRYDGLCPGGDECWLPVEGESE